MVSEKHREIAEKCANDFRMIGDGCEGDLIEIIAAALANAEREGMKRAAEIANKLAADQRQTNVRNPRHAECYPDWVKRITHYERVAAAILSEITNQPGSSSLPADSAPEAGFSSSTVSGVTHSNPRLTSAGTPPVDAANCESIAQAADASPSYSEQEG